ncbi:hypothetical protein J2P12_06460 [Candidatus Bathyarchaeota archaeon]|nr:hypothetical protein [Candidatus Bathyarchaeota archaeon]
MTRRGRPPSSRTKIALAITVLAVVGIFTYLYYIQSLQGQSSGLLIDWRLTVTFVDSTGPTNYTLPAYIGSLPQYWTNHSLDAFSPNPNYSPMSTRDGTSTIWIQSTQPAVFNFGDFFNVYGQVFNETCVGYSGIVAPNNTKLSGTYCTRAADPLIYDTNNNGLYDPSSDINVTMAADPLSPKLPAAGATLSSDPHITFVSLNNNPSWNNTESIVYDANGDGFYQSSDRVLYNGNRAQPLTSGTLLSRDTRLRFYDWNRNGSWDHSIPPPILSDGNRERCLDRRINLSNGHDWLIFLWSSGLYTTISGHCVPASG